MNFDGSFCAAISLFVVVYLPFILHCIYSIVKFISAEGKK